MKIETPTNYEQVSTEPSERMYSQYYDSTDHKARTNPAKLNFRRFSLRNHGLESRNCRKEDTFESASASSSDMTPIKDFRSRTRQLVFEEEQEKLDSPYD